MGLKVDDSNPMQLIARMLTKIIMVFQNII